MYGNDIWFCENTPEAIANRVIDIKNSPREEIIRRVEKAYIIYETNFSVNAYNENVGILIDNVKKEMETDMEKRSGLIDILIPTMNRESCLIKNLHRINNYIKNLHLGEKIGVIISDNCSTENSFLSLKSYLENSYEFDYELYRQESNIGIEENTLFLINKSNAKYVMTLGDDDYFSAELLAIIWDYCTEGKYTVIIPNFYIINGEGIPLANSYRDKIQEDKEYSINDMWISEKGHQLSCLTFLREGVVESYRANVKPNVYPFIYFIAFNLTRGSAVHVTREPFANTVIPKKNFDYQMDNLMDEFSIVIDGLPYKDAASRRKNLWIIIRHQAHKYCNWVTVKHPVRFFAKLRNYKVPEQIKLMIIVMYFVYAVYTPIRKVKRTILKMIG